MQQHRFHGLAVCSLVGTASLMLGGCAATRPQSFVNSFLPSTPLAAPADVPIEKPPHVYSTISTVQMTNVPPKIQPEVERRLKASEEHFEAGKRAYQVGDSKMARDEFDRSLDILLSAAEDLPDRHKLEVRLDELVDSIYRYDLDRLGAVETNPVYEKSPLEGMLEMTFPKDPKLTPKVTEEIQATVSQLPLESNDTVLSYINYFSTETGRRKLQYGLRRAGRYRSLIQHIFDEEGVPQELICLAQAESAFMPRAISYRAATGMWQFMRDTGQEYGLQSANGFDERLDPEKSTRAAARMLRDLYVRFGDWYLAMAAYNCGPGCVEAAVARTGFADFWELAARNVLPRETVNYVPLILAMTIMTKNPKDYGLDLSETERAMEYDSLNLTAATNLALVADVLDRPVSELTELNPALLRAVAPAGYALHVPKGSASTVTAALDNVPESRRAAWRMHRVQPGETLAAIAKQFGTPAEAVASANNHTLEAPEAGDLIVIPVPAEPSRKSVAHRATAHNVQTAKAGRVSSRALNQRAVPRAAKTASLARANTAQ